MDDNTSIQFRLRLAQINGIKMNEAKDHVSTEIDYVGDASDREEDAKTHGVKITPSRNAVQGSDHRVSGPPENVRKFLKHHYDGDEAEARENHPEVFKGMNEAAPMHNVTHPDHGIIGVHSADRGFVPSKPNLGFKPSKTIPNGAKMGNRVEPTDIGSKKTNKMNEEQIDEVKRSADYLHSTATEDQRAPTLKTYHTAMAKYSNLPPRAAHIKALNDTIDKHGVKNANQHVTKHFYSQMQKHLSDED